MGPGTRLRFFRLVPRSILSADTWRKIDYVFARALGSCAAMAARRLSGNESEAESDPELHSSILTIKLAKTEPCHKYEPTCEVLERAKKATMEYNRAHSKK